MTRRYRPIEDYALIGDGLTAALVSRDGSIDWTCFPRFDSPSVFARILDADAGGVWRIAPVEDFAAERHYLSDTNVLVTTFRTGTGRAELVDFMPAPSTGPDRLGDSAIVRILRGREGVVAFDWVFEPRFDYGRGEAEWSLQERCGARAEHGDAALTLLTESPLRLGNRGVEGRCVARAGEEMVFVLTWRQPASGLWRRDLLRTAHRALDETVAFWQRWIGRCAYRGDWEAVVRRSALTLKLLDYAPTGGTPRRAAGRVPAPAAGDDHRGTPRPRDRVRGSEMTHGRGVSPVIGS